MFGPLYVRPLKDGRFEFICSEQVSRLIVQLGSQLDGVLESGAPDLNRLFPTAYPNDPERDAGYQILARGELIDYRRTALDTVKATQRHEVLTEDELASWMTVVNDLRLVLGTTLDVGEGDHEIDPDDPSHVSHAVYHLLGEVLSYIVDALSSGLPPEGTENR